MELVRSSQRLFNYTLLSRKLQYLSKIEAFIFDNMVELLNHTKNNSLSRCYLINIVFLQKINRWITGREALWWEDNHSGPPRGRLSFYALLQRPRALSH